MNRQCPGGTRPYMIQPGDTFYALAVRYNLTVQSIINANPGVDPDTLQIGQTICLPEASAVCPEGNPYRVKQGDTFYRIARFFNISVDDLIEANPTVNPDQLRIGQIICIPVATPPVTCPAGTRTYIIQRGDTFWGLARRYNTTVAAIQAANPGVNPEALLVGQRICIPGATTPVGCPSGTRAYTIQSGDTFWSLASRFNTTVAAIQAANPGVNPDALQVGQRICIPV